MHTLCSAALVCHNVCINVVILGKVVGDGSYQLDAKIANVIVGMPNCIGAFGPNGSIEMHTECSIGLD